MLLRAEQKTGSTTSPELRRQPPPRRDVGRRARARLAGSRRARAPHGHDHRPAQCRRAAGARRPSAQLVPARPRGPLGVPARALPGLHGGRHRARATPLARLARLSRGSLRTLRTAPHASRTSRIRSRAPARTRCMECRYTFAVYTYARKQRARKRAMKTKESRFQVHDELTAPERSVPVLKGALAGGGQLLQLRRRARGLAGGAARLRALPLRAAPRRARRWATQQRIALAVAEHQGSEYALATLQRTAREAGLGLDEIALAREFDSRDEREAVLLRYVQALLESDGPPPMHLHEEAREAGWSDEQILEAVAHVALAAFANLVTRAGDVPDGRLGRGSAAAPGRREAGGARIARTMGSAGSTSCGPERPRAAASARLLRHYHRGGRAGGQALDGRDPARADGRPAALLRGQAARARPLGPPALRADEGARGGGHRGAPRDRRDARARGVLAHREGRRRSSPPCARSRPGPAPGSELSRSLARAFRCRSASPTKEPDGRPAEDRR